MPRTECRDPLEQIHEALRQRDRPECVGDDADQTPHDRSADEALAALSKRWRREHERAARRQQKALLADAPAASAAERTVIGAAAKDLALAETLWRSQVELASRVNALIDSPKAVLLLARALREVTACRSAATTRAEQLLLAVGTLAAQRQLSNPDKRPALRRVV